MATARPAPTRPADASLDRCLLFTCEHGGNRVPARYADCFRQARAALDSHRGFDAGSLELARRLASRFQAPLIAATVTRLLVDLNRSVGHPRHFSEFTAHLPPEVKAAILRRYYLPHRDRVAAAIAEGLRQAAGVLHIGFHSFTPVLGSQTRRADIGLLYDPARPSERTFCRRWQQELKQQNPGLVVLRNYPYLGKSDGLTTALRRRFPGDCYLGIELEINQRWTQQPPAERRRLADVLTHSLAAAIGGKGICGSPAAPVRAAGL